MSEDYAVILEKGGRLDVTAEYSEVLLDMGGFTCYPINALKWLRVWRYIL